MPYILKTKNPHLRLFNGGSMGEVMDYFTKVINKHFKNASLRVLDIGGGTKPMSTTFNYTANSVHIDVLDIVKRTCIIKTKYDYNYIVGDITDPNLKLQNKYDVIFTSNTFEHILNPWDATPNILNLLKEGGLLIFMAPFSWRYHAVPVDTYRYTHTGAQYLFERLGQMKKLEAGYVVIKKSPMPKSPNHTDAFIGKKIFTDTQECFYIGLKRQAYKFSKSNLDSS